MQRDLHHNINPVPCLPSTTVGTTGTGRTSKIIDRLGYQGVEFLINYGSVTATNATVTLNLREASATGGPFTSVADLDMLPQSGAELAASLGATSSRVSGTSKNLTKKLGYIGAKRYLVIGEVPTVSAGIDIGIEAVLHSPSHAPAGAVEV